MRTISDSVKEELYKALEGERSGMFVVNGKQFSIEVNDLTRDDENLQYDDLAQEIEDYPELKESLQRYLEQPDMKRYTLDEVMEKRRGKRK